MTSDVNLFVGDINIDLFSDESGTQEYQNILSEQGLLSAVNGITRPQSGTCVDHIFFKTGITVENVISLTLQVDITDHYPVALVLARDQSVSKRQILKTKKIIKYADLNESLREELWTEAYESQNIDVAAEAFIDRLKLLIDRSTSSIKLIRKRKDWITPGIMKSIEKKNHMYKQMKHGRSSDPDMIGRYRQYKNHIEKLIRITKMDYYKKQILKNSANPRKLWQVISNKKAENPKIIINVNDSEQIIEAAQVAEAFNSHFASIGPKLVDEIRRRSTNTEKLPNRKNNSKMVLELTNEAEILEMIGQLKSHKAPGLDQISSITLKHIGPNIVKPLVHLVNLSIKSGQFPMVFKSALIRPLFKSGSKQLMNNYRPISLTSNLSKVFEKVVHKRTMKFLDACNVLSDRQYGFRRGISTQDAIAHLTSMIYDCLDRSKPCLCIFLDIAKAFDSVDHEEMLRTLEDYGFVGNTLDWFRSFLTGRSQCVQIEDSLSSFTAVTVGVPQGTILGPILFLLYTNSLFGLETRSRIISFADDTAMFLEAETWQELKMFAESDFNLISKYLRSKILTLNIEKTVFVPFSNSVAFCPTFTSLVVDDHCMIHSADTVKYLGVVLDKHLRWKQQINKIVHKLRTLIQKFKNLRRFCDAQLLRTLYLVLVQPHLTYGLLGWGGIVKTHLNKLEITQKWILKIILNKPYRFPTDELFRIAAVMDMRQLFFLALAVHQRKNIMSASFNEHGHDTRNRGQLILLPTSCGTKGQRSHLFLAPRVYNGIPQVLKIPSIMTAFKKKIKSWILSQSRHFIASIIDIKNTYNIPNQ